MNNNSFRSRFNISIDKHTADSIFITRVTDRIFNHFLFNILNDHEIDRIVHEVAYELGVSYTDSLSLDGYYFQCFLDCLHVLEVVYHNLNSPDIQKAFTDRLNKIIKDSDYDLGIAWENNVFIPAGAELLDKALINDSLDWIRVPKYSNALAPFSKALEYLLKSKKYPKYLNDVIRDMYESLEALSKTITNRQDKDLSANMELFLKAIKAPHEYKDILKAYILYANKYRHATKNGEKRPDPPYSEVEAFVYLTGLFVRYAIESSRI